MKDLLKYTIYLVILVVIIYGSIEINNFITNRFTNKNIDNTEVENLKNEIIKFKDSINLIIFEYNNIIDIQKHKIDSITHIKNKTKVFYEKAETNFNDSNIITDDSVLRYVAKKIQD